MDRKSFIKNSCITCIGVAFGGALLEGCVGTKYVAGIMNDNGILLDLKEFDRKNKTPHPYIIIRHDDLKYPICVYRIDADKYSALLMSCTHQCVELQVSGDQLTCPAHGSEFNKYGQVMQAPAAEPLRTFPVSVTSGQLFIDMRKQV